MRIPIHYFISVQQEDPYKLVLLAKDTKLVCVTNADFFFTNGELAFVSGDEEGIIRIYEYNPQGTSDSISIPEMDVLTDYCHVLDPDSGDGRHLLLRTEFHGQSEYRTSTIIARRLKEDSDIPQSKLLMGKASVITYFIY